VSHLRILPANRAPTVGNRYATDKDESNASINYEARSRMNWEASGLIVIACIALGGLAWVVMSIRACVS
jgi:hypothetical protein